MLLLFEVQDPLKPPQCPPGVIILQPLRTVVLVLNFYFVIICGIPTLICVVLRSRVEGLAILNYFTINSARAGLTNS